MLYLATSPDLFPVICEQLGASGLNGPNVRVVLEKPLGHDLASALEINRVVRSAFAESQALRIDHYLGKPAVQNLMALRFGNALFEPLWRRESIANIQITLAETLGVGTRGDYYDSTGALRDMVQNHALQLLTMIAMEPPSTNDADAIRDEKLKVLKSLRPFTPEQRGARRRARPVPRRHRRRASRARLPGRGQGARRQPLRNLRRAAHRGAELALGRRALLPAHRQAPGHARRADRRQLPRGAAPDLPRHAARQQAGHQAAARGRAGAAPAGGQGQQATTNCSRPVSLDLDFDKAFPSERVGAYERLLLDAIAGRLNLFVRSDEQEQAWRWVMPVLEAWAADPAPPRPYAAGSWGPAGGQRAGGARRLRLGGGTVKLARARMAAAMARGGA